MSMILTDASVSQVFRSNRGPHRSGISDHILVQCDEERQYLLPHAVSQLNLKWDKTPYRISPDTLLTLQSHRVYSQVSFTYNGHNSCPDLIRVRDNGVDIIAISVSYHPIKDVVTRLGLTRFLCEQLGYLIVSTQAFCINPTFCRDSNLGNFFKPVIVSSKTTQIARTLSHYINTSPSTCIASKPSLACDTSADIFQLTKLPYKKKLSYFKSGIKTFHDILSSLPDLTKPQQKQCHVEITQTPFVDLPILQAFLSKLSPTIQFFDIEACQFPYPILYTTKPFEVFPFLFSVHYLNQDSHKTSHSLQFYDPDMDFRRQFAESLIHSLDPSQSIIVFDTTLERSICRYFSDIFPDLSDIFSLILDQFVDISSLFFNHHVLLPGMQGKYSIKHIIKAINTANPYLDLSIQSGFFASHAYKQLVYDPHCNHHQIKQSIIDYASTDTHALLLVYHYLLKLVEN